MQFYLHFELNDENHAHQLYDEMIEILIGLKNKKTTRVLLSCSSGLTTSMFADNLNSVVEMLGEDYHFDAVAYSNIYEQVENYDLVLIAPQIGYMLKRLQESLPDKLVLQIPTATFASMMQLVRLNLFKVKLKIIIKKRKKNKLRNVTVVKNQINVFFLLFYQRCKKSNKRILSIVLSTNRAQTRIYYRVYE